MIWALLIIIAIIVIYLIATYNQLVKFKARIKASIQEIGNQLKRQADLIPNLQETAKAYLKQEKSIFQLLTDARKAVNQAIESGDLGQVGAANDMLTNALQGLRVVVESNPEIKSDQVMIRLMSELRDATDKVTYARRTLIDLSADYNIMIQAFPSNIVANLFGFKPEAGLEMPESSKDATSVSQEELKTPKVKFD